jgi:hypothetical protein
LAAVDGTVAEFDAAAVWPGGIAPPVGRTNCGRTAFGTDTGMPDRSRTAEIGDGEVGQAACLAPRYVPHRVSHEIALFAQPTT